MVNTQVNTQQTNILFITNPTLLRALTPQKRHYTFDVRYADESNRTYNITILPRKGQNYNDAVTALREMIRDNRRYVGYSAVSFKCIKTVEV
jgi:hypothetical protein